ncbi:hypothetical protein CRG98_033647 [Punica granatum]|uniref:Uncharacterized protein n=1 Tax=Punica granatum TaxID=22663 RepID=A0A2I0IPU5_PUNGR|nr:hypothetical protein CRG98_033647 [Punica granatum]
MSSPKIPGAQGREQDENGSGRLSSEKNQRQSAEKKNPESTIPGDGRNEKTANPSANSKQQPRSDCRAARSPPSQQASRSNGGSGAPKRTPIAGKHSEGRRGAAGLSEEESQNLIAGAPEKKKGEERERL